MALAVMGTLTASIPLLWFLLAHQVRLSLLNWTLYDVTQSYLTGEVGRHCWCSRGLLCPQGTSQPEAGLPHLHTEFLPCVMTPEKRLRVLAST